MWENRVLILLLHRSEDQTKVKVEQNVEVLFEMWAQIYMKKDLQGTLFDVLYPYLLL